MKVTVELSDSEMSAVCRVTGQRKKGPAIRQLVVDALMLQRRREMTEKFVSGEWSAALGGFEAARRRDRRTAKRRATVWRK